MVSKGFPMVSKGIPMVPKEMWDVACLRGVQLEELLARGDKAGGGGSPPAVCVGVRCMQGRVIKRTFDFQASEFENCTNV